MPAAKKTAASGGAASGFTQADVEAITELVLTKLARAGGSQ
jgi:hypothetical protein